MASKRASKRNRLRQSESMQRLKPELMFVESPLQGSKYYSTPVQAARNPYMAPSIAVDESSYKWVSPQFPKGTVHEKRKRRHKKTNEENKTRQITHPKIPSLEFKYKSTKKSKKSKDSGLTANIRRSKRLEEKQHFLFQRTMGFTPERNCVKVLVDDTPENSLFPVVLRRLREARRRSKYST